MRRRERGGGRERERGGEGDEDAEEDEDDGVDDVVVASAPLFTCFLFLLSHSTLSTI